MGWSRGKGWSNDVGKQARWIRRGEFRGCRARLGVGSGLQRGEVVGRVERWWESGLRGQGDWGSKSEHMKGHRLRSGRGLGGSRAGLGRSRGMGGVHGIVRGSALRKLRLISGVHGVKTRAKIVFARRRQSSDRAPLR